MGTIRLENVTVQFGPHVVLNDVTTEWSSGHRIGLVGPNGAGKTTLFRLITGQLQPDTGRLTRSRGMRVGYLAQEPQVDPGRTLHDEALSAFDDLLALETQMHQLSDQIASADGQRQASLMAEYDRLSERFVAAGGYEYETRLAEILGGLGFSPDDYNLPVTALSGGQKCRLALARLLLQDNTYLLLDEPTNHLDIDAVRWLERFLASHKGGAAIISHDRYLLDRVADSIIEVDRAQLTNYPGNYSNYVKTRALRELSLQRQVDKDRAFIEKERAFIAKHLAGQRTAEAKGRRKRLERQLAEGRYELHAAAERKSVRFEFDVEPLPNRTLIEVDRLAKAFGDKRLFGELSFQLASGQRLGITGPNGTGKSTLLKIIIGQLEPDAGQVRIDGKADIGYYAQQPDELEPSMSVLEAIREVRRDLTELQARSLLGSFLFTAEAVFKRLGDLSGGEQSRVRLIRLLLRNPNLLILDEPTNHLDIPSREALEAALSDYPGTILAVSHDRYFLDRIVNRMLILRDGTHTGHLGNYSNYLKAAESAPDSPRATVTTARKTPHRGRARLAKPKKPPKSELDRLSLDELEARIMDLEQKLADQHAQFADPDVYKDKKAITRLRAESARIKAALAEAEDAWNRRADDS